MHQEIPDKLYFKIGEVAKMAGVPAHVLRYWESEFPQIRPKRASSNQRLYRKQDVSLILTIKSLLHDQGYTIAGARKWLDSGPARETPTDPVQPVAPKRRGKGLKQQLLLIKHQLEELQELLKSQ